MVEVVSAIAAGSKGGGWSQGVTGFATFEVANEPLAAGTAALLARCITDPALHARLMNTLSLLEHMGSHKIMATQHRGDIDQPTLKHLADETRHAYFFKRQAEKTADRPLQYKSADLLMPASARMYFQRLEACIVRSLPRPAHKLAVYLYMSMIVEFRAIWAYGLYQDALIRLAHPLSLRSLLAEESGHLAEMEARLDEIGAFDRGRVGAFCAIERRLYEKLLQGFERAVENSA